LTGLSADRAAHRVRNVDALITWAARNNVRALAVERAHLVRKDCLKAVAQRVDPSNPTKTFNDAWARDGVAGVDGEDEDTQTSEGLGGSLGAEEGGDGAEPALHDDSHSKDEEQEHAEMARA